MTDWLTANITPIFKKGNRSSPLNYRPISLTAVCCKVLEHIIYYHIMEHLSQYQVIHNYQHGFRQGYSAESQLITVTEDILYAIDHKLQTDVILLDFQKAFDTVPYQRLLSKLSSYGIQNETYSWINSWLSWGKQRVIVDGSASAWTPVKPGVPQRTVLGPLMFLFLLMILGTEYPLICGFLLMIVYFIELLHPWKTPNNYNMTLIVFQSGNGYGK